MSGPGPAQDTVLYPDLMLFAAPHDLGHVCDHGQKSLAGYIVHVPGILQAKILEWVAMPSSKGSS